VKKIATSAVRFFRAPGHTRGKKMADEIGKQMEKHLSHDEPPLRGQKP